MTKAQIIAEIAKLPPEDKAEVAAFLQAQGVQAKTESGFAPAFEDEVLQAAAEADQGVNISPKCSSTAEMMAHLRAHPDDD